SALASPRNWVYLCAMAKGLPRWAEIGRLGWVNTGSRRPAFADTPGPGQESVWDYPRPPALVGDDRHVRVLLGDTVVADTRRAARVLETSHPPTFYLPREDVNDACLVRAEGRSGCEWKGVARYWDVVAGARREASVGWSYDAPFEEFVPIAGHIAFYASRLSCFVDGEPVGSQPGDFYGGWVTPELVGPFKGGAGSGGW
ncbi:MAG: DUF427 domain-containing protein, partial [Sandaracinaceae bacterium]